VHEVPPAQRALLALDDQHRLAGEHEEVLLVGFPVVHRHRLARAEQRQVDPELVEVRRTVEARALELAEHPAPRPLPPLRLARVDDEPPVPLGDEAALGLQQLRLVHRRSLAR